MWPASSRPRCRSAAPMPAPRLMLTIRDGIRFVEIPVNYLPRVGKSPVTGSRITAFFSGPTMIRLILARLRSLFRGI